MHITGRCTDRAIARFVLDGRIVETMNIPRYSNASALAARDGDDDAFSLGGAITTLVDGLLLDDCLYMASIGMAYQGINSAVGTDKTNTWIGSDGANTFGFKNNAGVRATLVMWEQAAGDYESSFMNARRAKVTYSLNASSTVTVSVSNGVSGGWAVLYDHATTLSQYGQVDEVWGEYTTGDYATVDLSFEVNASGTPMTVTVAENGCVSDKDTCSFHCYSGDTCGESGTYELVNCDNGSQAGATSGSYDGINPEGGCQGWSNGGHLDISLGQ
ncbi:hypothetical protein M426DRAFT_21353 [Hypoxylon sp. CI-4A]|nr:hypothetical protein M426DRAFT_21353 [Hypoxylon sp. CI-4A]